jgi:hypothetical protein
VGNISSEDGNKNWNKIKAVILQYLWLSAHMAFNVLVRRVIVTLTTEGTLSQIKQDAQPSEEYVHKQRARK